MTVLNVATEDELSEAIALRLLAERQLAVGQKFRNNGSGYLKSRLEKFCQLAAYQPLLLITDLDRIACPTELAAEWFKGRVVPPGLLFRIAVREAEAWLLADHEAMREFLRRPQLRLPINPDSLSDPKQELIKLARSGPRLVRDSIVPPSGSTATKGLGYNQILVGDYLRRWNPERAAERSESLRRARRRLAAIKNDLPV